MHRRVEGARIVMIDFSAAVNRGYHQGIIYKSSSRWVVGGSVLLSAEIDEIDTSRCRDRFDRNCVPVNRSQHFMVDSCQRKLVNVVS